MQEKTPNLDWTSFFSDLGCSWSHLPTPQMWQRHNRMNNSRNSLRTQGQHSEPKLGTRKPLTWPINLRPTLRAPHKSRRNNPQDNIVCQKYHTQEYSSGSACFLTWESCYNCSALCSWRISSWKLVANSPGLLEFPIRLLKLFGFPKQHRVKAPLWVLDMWFSRNSIFLVEINQDHPRDIKTGCGEDKQME